MIKAGIIGASGYAGNETLRLLLSHPNCVVVAVGGRVAQMVIAPYFTADFELCDELSDTVRGEGGFGSTGRK